MTELPPLGNEDDDQPDSRSRAVTAHRLGTEIARTLVQEGCDRKLNWSELLVTCETVVAIVIATVSIRFSEQAGSETRQRFAQESIDLMTERAYRRIRKLLAEYEERCEGLH